MPLIWSLMGFGWKLKGKPVFCWNSSILAKLHHAWRCLIAPYYPSRVLVNWWFPESLYLSDMYGIHYTVAVVATVCLLVAMEFSLHLQVTPSPQPVPPRPGPPTALTVTCSGCVIGWEQSGAFWKPFSTHGPSIIVLYKLVIAQGCFAFFQHIQVHQACRHWSFGPQ